MNTQILITISGAYQAHFVNLLSEKTHHLGGKWLTSKINHIDGYMAGLIKVELDVDNVDTLLHEFKALPINVEWVELTPLTNEKTKHLDLSIDAKDRAGLVRDISQVLSENNINVESMECNRVGVPSIGDVIFTSHFKVAVSDSFDKEALIDHLQSFSDDFLIDINEL